MPIITISRGSYSRGREVAEKVAAQMGYECVARDVLLEASKEFNVEEMKLVQAIQDAPSLLGRLSYDKERFIAYIRAALLSHLKKDNVVYHGLAGQFFVRDVGHALNVRVIADMEDRIQLVMERDGVSRKAAIRFINRIDKERSRWSQQLYGIDPADPRLYDLVLHVNKISVDDAVDIICHTVQLECLQATEESRRAIEDAALSAAVKATLITDYPDIDVTSQDGEVFVTVKASGFEDPRFRERVASVAKSVPGVVDVKVKLHWYAPFGT